MRVNAVEMDIVCGTVMLISFTFLSKQNYIPGKGKERKTSIVQITVFLTKYSFWF